MERNIFTDTRIAETISDSGESIFPFFSEKNVAICMCCSNEYAPFACVTISSILMNSSEEYNYDIILLSNELSQGNKNSIFSFCQSKSNIAVRFIDVSKYLEGLKFYTWAHFKQFTYYRLLIPEVLSNYEKVIYLDCDIVVNSDIAELYETDVNGYFLAAAIDTHVMGRCNPNNPLAEPKYYNDVLKIDERGYFQAGVILFNINAFKNQYQKMELIEKACQSTYRWLDQDFLNVECRGKVKFISNCWNVMIINTPNVCIDEMYLPENLYQEYISARIQPKIIHYIGKNIPCFVPHADLYRYFWKYARNTPYYELILFKMISQTEKRIMKQLTLKQRIKKEWVMPVVNKLFPKKSKRRHWIKYIYFHIRGWEVV